MKNLRQALGKDDPYELHIHSDAKPASSIRTIKSNTSQSLWIGGGSDDEDGLPTSAQTRLGEQILDKIKSCIARDEAIDEATLEAVIVASEKNYGKSKEKDIVESLLKISKKLLIKAPPDLEGHLLNFSELLRLRLKKIKKKEERATMQYEEIAEKMMKKPKDEAKLKENRKKVLEINLKSDLEFKKPKKKSKIHDSNGTKNSGSGSQDSGENKLGRLLSSEKGDASTSNYKKPDGNQYQEEGYSFSAIMSGSMAVKQRSKPQESMPTQSQQPKSSKNVNDDEAFVFYRPTKRR